MARPWNSITRKLAPSAEIIPMTYRMRSFAPTPGLNSPSATTLMVGGTSTLTMRPSAQTPAMSVAPTPIAIAPMQPWLLVWLSAPMTTEPGST